MHLPVNSLFIGNIRFDLDIGCFSTITTFMEILSMVILHAEVCVTKALGMLTLFLLPSEDKEDQFMLICHISCV